MELDREPKVSSFVRTLQKWTTFQTHIIFVITIGWSPKKARWPVSIRWWNKCVSYCSHLRITCIMPIPCADNCIWKSFAVPRTPYLASPFFVPQLCGFFGSEPCNKRFNSLIYIYFNNVIIRLVALSHATSTARRKFDRTPCLPFNLSQCSSASLVRRVFCGCYT